MRATVATAAPADVTLRPRPATREPGTVYCSDCWEPIAHDGAIWRHVRTGRPAAWHDKQCAPLCDWPDCQAEGTVALQDQVFNGAGIVWRTEHFLCAAHAAQRTRTHGRIVRT